MILGKYQNDQAQVLMKQNSSAYLLSLVISILCFFKMSAGFGYSATCENKLSF